MDVGEGDDLDDVVDIGGGNNKKEEVPEGIPTGRSGGMDSVDSAEHPDATPSVEYVISRSSGVLSETDVRLIVASFRVYLEMDPRMFSKGFLSWMVPFCYRFFKNKSPLDMCQPLYGSPILAEELIVPILEVFLNRNNHLKSLGKKGSSVCCRVFQGGDPQYSCHDCSLDASNVLCSDCFDKSGHKNHRYTITISDGGGFCNCGDLEVWKMESPCVVHNSSSNNDKPVAEENYEVADIQPRARFLFYTLLNYAYTMLATELTVDLPDELEFRETFLLTLFEHSNEIRKQMNTNLFCTFAYDSMSFDMTLALKRALGVSTKVAACYGAIVTEHGRVLLKIGEYEECLRLKAEVDHADLQLKLVIVRADVVMHQIFAMRILKWIEGLLDKHAYFRTLFADIIEMNDNHRNFSILTGVLQHGLTMWKSAKRSWYDLFVVGMLKDYSLKKRFAIVFAKNYHKVMETLKQDSPNSPFTIASLSGSIFNVPSIAHYLIEHHQIFNTIVGTLLKELELAFNTNSITSVFFDMAADLKCLLSVPPKIWTNNLAENFNEGMNKFVRLLRIMQEMDPLIRQRDVHVEYETSGKAVFELQLKLQPIITLSLQWLAAYKFATIYAFFSCLLSLGEEYEDALTTAQIQTQFANYSTKLIVCTGTTSSVHMALSRYFAGVCLLLDKHGLQFQSLASMIQYKPSPAFIMDPCLRTQVFVAQVNAGMWTRNGFSVLERVRLYTSPKHRLETLDKDIVALQITASLMEPNEFLIHVLNRFGILPWVKNDFQRLTGSDVNGFSEEQEHLSALLAEFLGLVINIFSARFTTRVGQTTARECVKKEVIQLLCIEPMKHSTLEKQLTSNASLKVDLDLVLDEVAMFKKGLSVYELKSNFYKDFDWHYAHYSKEQLSVAEDGQRERKRLAKEPQCFPPPKLPPFWETFSKVPDIVRCDVLLKLMCLVLEQILTKTSDSVIFGDLHVRRILHIIGHGINEEAADRDFRFCDFCQNWGVFEKLNSLLQDKAMSQYHDMILWINMEKNKLFVCDINSSAHLDSSANAQRNEDEKQKRAKMAAKSKEKMLARMAAAQKSFMAANSEQFSVPTDAADTTSGLDKNIEESESVPVICVGPSQTDCRNEDIVCSICRDEEPLTTKTLGIFVSTALIQRSSVLCETRDQLHKLEQLMGINSIEQTRIWLRRNLLIVPHVSSCGHVMHYSCWKSYMIRVIRNSVDRPWSTSFDLNEHEYLCPHCNSLCNSIIPLAPPLQKLYVTSSEEIEEYILKVIELIRDKSLNNRSQTEKVSSPSPVEESGTGNSRFETRTPTETKAAKKKWKPFRIWLYFMDEMKKEKNSIQFIRNSGQYGEQFLKVLHGHDCVDESGLDNFGEARSAIWEYNNQLRVFMGHFVQLINAGKRNSPFREFEFYAGLHQALWRCLAYTIASAEACNRNQSICFFGKNVPIRTSHALTFLTRACCSAVSKQVYLMEPSAEGMRVELFQLVDYLWHPDATKPCILEWDSFELLVLLTCLMPSAISDAFDETNAQKDPASNIITSVQPPVGSMRDHHVLRLAYTIHVTQLVVSISSLSEYIVHCCDGDTCTHHCPIPDQINSAMDFSRPSNMKKLIMYLWSLDNTRCVSDFAIMSGCLDVNKLWLAISQKMVPFLRCCAKFYECISGISPPDTLETLESCFDDLIRYLDLPKSLPQIFDAPEIVDLCIKWCKHPSMQTELPKKAKTSSFEYMCKLPLPRNLPKLVNLPSDYVTIINAVSQFACPKSGLMGRSKNPTMCLVCGKIFCSQCYCCRVSKAFSEVQGACRYHSNFCSGGVGIFLQIRQCRVFLLNGSKKGCFIQPPYINRHGETDQGLRRGYPLTLDEEKYKQLQRLWISHGIPEEIAREMERNIEEGVLLNEWQFV